MRSIRTTVLSVCTLCFVFCTPVLAQYSQDFLRLSERTIMGTARYIGMAGAMSAIGGDPSSVKDNPAGLGLYRRAELMLTTDVSLWQGDRLFTVPQASWEFSIPTNKLKEAGVLYHNFMFSYNRLHTYDNSFIANGENDHSLGDRISGLNVNWGDFQYCTDYFNTINRTKITEYGAVHEFAFNWGMNVSNTWYVGAGIRVQHYNFHSIGSYSEDFARKNEQGKNMYLDNATSLYLGGAGCSAAFGLIYRPISWVRLGLGLETPSFGGINTRSSGTLTALTDSVRQSSSIPNPSNSNRFHQAFRTTASAALQVGAYGLLAFQYDYRHAYYMDDIHTLKVGLEFIPVLGLYVNLGYAYESTFKPYKPAPMDETFVRQDTYSFYPRVSQYASAAFGYRGTYMIVQAAYQFHWKQTAFYPLDDVAPFDIYNTTHRIVFTIAWHKD